MVTGVAGGGSGYLLPGLLVGATRRIVGICRRSLACAGYYVGFYCGSRRADRVLCVIVFGQLLLHIWMGGGSISRGRTMLCRSCVWVLSCATILIFFCRASEQWHVCGRVRLRGLVEL